MSEWTADAAITASYFPAIRDVLLTNISFACESSGLIHAQLPLTLEWIAFDTVDMSVWIDSIGSNWSMLKYFYCDSCEPRAFQTLSRR